MPPSLTKINGDAHTLEQFIKDLEFTSRQVEDLLREVRGSELDFVSFKTELRILCDNVKELSTIIRDGDGDGSLLTKFALLKQRVDTLEKDINKNHDDKRVQQISLASIEVAEKSGKWQLRVSMIAGGLALIGTIASEIFHYYK